MTEKIEAEGKLMQWSEEDQTEAAQLKEQLEEQLSAVRVHEAALETGYVELGRNFLRVRQKRYWCSPSFGSHRTWTDYIESFHERIGRFQLFRIVGVVETLSDRVSDSDLMKMGITKAAVLRSLVLEKPDSQLPENVVDAALDPKSTVEDLRKVIFEETNVQQEHPGKYRDLGGFYATDEEWEEVKRACDVAERVDPPISKEIPKWAKVKEIVIRLCREFLATYEAEVEGH